MSSPTSTSPQRFSYRPSGRVTWKRFVPWFFATLLCALLAADAAFRIDRYGFYLPLLGPLFFGFGLALVATAAVAYGRCRSPLLGGLFGALTLLAFQTAFYQRSLLDAKSRGGDDNPVGVAELFRELPDYIWLRIRNVPGSKEEGAAPAAAPQGAIPAIPADDVASPPPTWKLVVRGATVAAEFLLLAWLGAMMVRSAAAQPFDEGEQVWQRATYSLEPRGYGLKAIAALDRGEGPPPREDSPLPLDATLTLYFNPGRDSGSACHLSVRDAEIGPDGKLQLKWHWSHVRLAGEEAGRVREYFFGPKGSNATTTAPEAPKGGE